MPSEADRLLAAGTTVTVAGGQETLRFTLAALKRCEDRYGNLDGLVKELHWLIEQPTLGYPTPVAERLMLLLQTVTGSPVPVDAWDSPAACTDALLDAWLEAFPAPEGKAEGAATAPSPGATGGASPSPTPT